MQIAKERIEIALQGAIICGDLSLRWQSSPLIIQLYSRGRQQVDERSRTVADLLNEAGLSTLTMDLLARDEGTQSAVPMQLRFNIDALSERVCGILRWLENAGYKPIGIFGTGTSSAAALIASAQLRCCVSAVVLFG